MLTLIVPGLIWTRQALADLTYDLPLPAFATLLGRGRLRHGPPQDTATTLAESAGLAAPLPAAALRWHALRGDSGLHDSCDWLCLDPVRLRFEQRSLILDDPRRLHLSHDESSALAAALAPIFSALGKLEAIAPDAWNLRLHCAAPVFQDLPKAAGRSASPLPLDAAYAPWRQAINEAQMLLHTHPVNRAREAAGQPAVNSLWPWGGGSLPAAGKSAHDALWSNDPIAQGIARVLRIDHATLPARFGDTNARAPLAMVEALEAPARTGDALVWRDELARFEADWMLPALDALRAGRLDALQLIAPGEAGSAELNVGRHDLWKFWRKPGTLTELARA
jgi:hypothetical protein